MFNLQMYCTFTCINSSPSLIFQFHQNNSQLLFHIMVSLRGVEAFSRDFTTNLAPQCRAFSGALQTEKLNVPLLPGPRGAGDTNDWCIIKTACAVLHISKRIFKYIPKADSYERLLFLLYAVDFHIKMLKKFPCNTQTFFKLQKLKNFSSKILIFFLFLLNT